MRDEGWNDEQDYFEGPGIAFDAARERRRRGLDCRDGMCGARDCLTCHPEGEDEDEGEAVDCTPLDCTPLDCTPLDCTPLDCEPIDTTEDCDA